MSNTMPVPFLPLPPGEGRGEGACPPAPPPGPDGQVRCRTVGPQDPLTPTLSRREREPGRALGLLLPALLLAAPAAAQAPQFTQGGITLLQDPAAITDAARKGYVDALVAAARAAAVPATTLGQPGGPARLGANGTLPIAQLPVGTAAGTVAAGDALAAVQAAATTAQARANLAAPAASLAPVATSGAYGDLTGRPVIIGLPTLAPVATSGAYNDLTGRPAIPVVPTLSPVATSGAYADLTGRPAIPVVPTLAPVATSGAYGDLTGRPTIPTVPAVGTAAGTLAAGNDARIVGAAQAASLAPVATSGAYGALSGTPTIPADTGQLTNGAGFVTAAGAAAASPVRTVAGRTGAVVLGAADVSGLAPVASSGAYADLSGKPAIPAVPAFGTVAGTVAQGNDSRILGAAQASALSAVATSGAYADLSGKPAIPAVPAYGTAAGTVAAGNDARITGAVQSAGGAMTGPLTLPQVNLGGALAFTGADGPGNRGLNASGTLTGTATDQQSAAYQIRISSDQASAPNGWIDHLQVQCTMGGGAFSGLRDCVHSSVGFNATPSAAAMAADASSRDLVSTLAEGYASAGWGGAAGPYAARGNLTGLNANVRVTAGAAFWNLLAGTEVNVEAGTGATLASKFGTLVSQTANDRVRGTYDDVALNFANQSGASRWGCGICFGNSFAQWPVADTGTLIGAVAATRTAPTVSPAALNGVDFRGVAFGAGGYAFASPGYTVDPAGGVAASTVNSPSVTSTGSLSAVGVTSNGQYPANAWPVLTVAAPGAAGSTATAVPATMGWTGGPGTFVSGGAGCSVNDVLTPAGAVGTPFQMKVTAVSAGAATAFVPAGFGAGSMTAPFPAASMAMTGGTCTTAPVYQPNLYLASVTVTGGGNGYATPPAVTASAGISNATAILAGTIGNTLTVAGNRGRVLMDATGTRLGTAGVAGGPVIFQAARADQAYARIVAANAGTAAFAANVSELFLDPAAGIAAFTVTLPATPVDGQTAVVSCGQAITTLTVNAAANQAMRPSGTTTASACTATQGHAWRWRAAQAAWNGLY